MKFGKEIGEIIGVYQHDCAELEIRLERFRDRVILITIYLMIMTTIVIIQ